MGVEGGLPAASAAASAPRRVALVHDWLTGMRGGERVLEAIAALYPEAPIYTLFRVPGTLSETLASRPTVTSPVNRLPWAATRYRSYLPLLPAAVELFDLDRYDLVISSSHCAVKSVIRPAGAVHVCYCHSPMRYAWDQFDAYFGPAQVGRLRSAFYRRAMARLARWDAATADRVDAYVANSAYVAARIRRYYNRGSTVVYPPVNTEFYRPTSGQRATKPHFAIVSALVPYKRLDVAIDACGRLGVPLTVAGTGPERARLEARAGDGARFLGWQSDEEVRELYRTATAVLLPGVEDFGMVPVEAQACGCPVVALDAGGARETVVPGVTGVLAPGGSVEAFADALDACTRLTFDDAAIRANAERFSQARFACAFQAAVDAALASRGQPA
jgi:glycosyltransferase involved in cell wall biosynthesis